MQEELQDIIFSVTKDQTCNLKKEMLTAFLDSFITVATILILQMQYFHYIVPLADSV